MPKHAEPWTLDHFRFPVTVHTSAPQWRQVVHWQRLRLVFVRALDRERAEITLTERGRTALQAGQ